MGGTELWILSILDVVTRVTEGCAPSELPAPSGRVMVADCWDGAALSTRMKGIGLVITLTLFWTLVVLVLTLEVTEVAMELR